MSAAFRYYPHNGERHAIPKRAVGGQVTTTLCEVELTVDADRKLGTERTCARCESAWRSILGIPQQSQRQALLDAPAYSPEMPADASAGGRR
ncbi:zinc finger protein [Saccharothrix sp.]|uniref:zinc finger protein n=1 Tax=Saccharothrix sp. TaxID=1873460 RepID=UPI0028122980|nr:zinc finger protein [Saccharothrix sp.]